MAVTGPRAARQRGRRAHTKRRTTMTTPWAKRNPVPILKPGRTTVPIRALIERRREIRRQFSFLYERSASLESIIKEIGCDGVRIFPSDLEKPGEGYVDSHPIVPISGAGSEDRGVSGLVRKRRRAGSRASSCPRPPTDHVVTSGDAKILLFHQTPGPAVPPQWIHNLPTEINKLKNEDFHAVCRTSEYVVNRRGPAAGNTPVTEDALLGSKLCGLQHRGDGTPPSPTPLNRQPRQDYIGFAI
ncbi:hypothetical protein J6590_066361 [Homalodisca vitripennis]|nr:hypothetical protein J6590_066361 [Homalodisca vitripennis]